MASSRLTFGEAREAASASLIFTTHTPVAAGHDYFAPELMDRYFADYPRALGLSHHDFLALGRQNHADESEPFGMTILALRLAAYSNGVSRLHGQVTRQMWQSIWQGVPQDEIPIGHVTNGVHLPSWISHEMDQLYERYLGPRWREEPADHTIWQRFERVPAEELWRTHERRRERLVAFTRRRLRSQLAVRGSPQFEIHAADDALDPEALTIGFARRFATYKRATLLLSDPERLARLLNDPARPVQIIFAGKAHPRDDAGKELIKKIVTLSRQEPFRRRLVFQEDYDMTVARYLVQGADVWLNTPRRPMEASGTSGMKAAANGALNLSVLDGWWDEAWNDAASKSIGWASGKRETSNNWELQDQLDAEALYDLLERDVVPTFYQRGADGLPRAWIERMKASIGSLSYFFNTHRMVRDYTERFYLPALARYEQLTAAEAARARALGAWRTRLQANWSRVGVESIGAQPLTQLQVGGTVRVQAQIRLGALTPDDVAVELYLGRVNAQDEIVEAEVTPMRALAPNGDGRYLYEASAMPCRQSGLHGYTVRVLPHHPDLVSPFLPGLIVWAG